RDQLGETAHIRVIQRRIHLVQYAEGRRLELEDAHQQRQRRQRLLAAREQQDVLQLLARRRSHNIDAGLDRVLLVGQPHEGLAAAEQLGEGGAEVLIDYLERLVELHPRNVV